MVSETPRFRVLFVCVGNICRSPFAQLVLTTLLPRESFEVGSAGVAALVGSAMSPHAAAHLEAYGASAEGFSARQLTSAMVDESDLVLTATREIRSSVLEESPRALRRTFTVREFAALLDAVESGPGAEADPRSVVASAAESRGHGLVEDYDIPDPFRRGAEAHAVAAATMGEAVERISKALGPRPVRRRMPPTPPPSMPPERSLRGTA